MMAEDEERRVERNRADEVDEKRILIIVKVENEYCLDE
jgi:hypothetical protein